MGGPQGRYARFGERKKNPSSLPGSDLPIVRALIWRIAHGLLRYSTSPMQNEFTCLSNDRFGDVVEPCTMMSSISRTIAKSLISILVFLDATLCSRMHRSRKSEGNGIVEVWAS